ncbi:hypothetical protein AC622_09010 [Bacillus sp. FJAT-27916]|nr:hypothetical protein AC622_09010 [Bacillus sp. FJAT-27916]
MRLVIILIILFFIILLIEKTIDKLLGVKRKNIAKTNGKKVDQWGRAIIVVIYLVYIVSRAAVTTEWHFILFLLTLMGYQAILEWKYLRGSKQYLSTLLSSMIIFSILSLTFTTIFK